MAVNLKKWDIVESPQIIIPCRPAFPEVNVTLFEVYSERINAFFDPKVGFIINDFKFNIAKTDYRCEYTYQDKIISQYVSIKKDGEFSIYDLINIICNIKSCRTCDF